MFAQRLKELRLDKNYSQKDLAYLLGVSKQNISDWENQKSETNFDMLIKIANVFDVTVGQILGTENL